MNAYEGHEQIEDRLCAIGSLRREGDNHLDHQSCPFLKSAKDAEEQVESSSTQYCYFSQHLKQSGRVAFKQAALCLASFLRIFRLFLAALESGQLWWPNKHLIFPSKYTAPPVLPLSTPIAPNSYVPYRFCATLCVPNPLHGYSMAPMVGTSRLHTQRYPTNNISTKNDDMASLGARVWYGQCG